MLFLHLVVLYGYQEADAALGELSVVVQEQPCMIVGDFNVEPTKIPCLAKGIRAGLWVDFEESWALTSGLQPASTCKRDWGAIGGHHICVPLVCMVGFHGIRWETDDGRRRLCVPGEMKASSMSTRRGVRRSAVDESAHPQQALLKLHDDTWAVLLRNPGLGFSQEEEIVPWCAVAVACPSCPDHSSEPPGPGIVIRNMLGRSLQEKTAGSVVWLFLGALRGENLFSSLLGRLGKEGTVPHSVGGPLWFLVHLFVCVRARPRFLATYWRAVLATASRCVEGCCTPDEA